MKHFLLFTFSRTPSLTQNHVSTLLSKRSILEDSARALRGERLAESFRAGARNAVRKRELDLGILSENEREVERKRVYLSLFMGKRNLKSKMRTEKAKGNRGNKTHNELEGVSTLNILCFNNASLDNLDGGRAATVTARHFVVHLVHSAIQGQITVFFVHIVCSGARIVTKPDAVHLKDVSVLLHDLIDSNNFSCGLLHLSILVHEIPVARACVHRITSKQLHAEDLRVRFRISRSLAAENLELTHLKDGWNGEEEGRSGFGEVKVFLFFFFRQHAMANKIRKYCLFRQQNTIRSENTVREFPREAPKRSWKGGIKINNITIISI
jgi:hypothetical protein